MSRRFTIGRDKECDVPIFDDSVSRLHAEIWLAEDGSLMMADRGSVNGTTVVRGQQKFPLNQDVILPGDYVRMGSVILSAGQIAEAVEAKYPGALTPGAARPRVGPPPPPPARQFSPPPAYGSPPYTSPAAAPRPGGALVRCSCGAIKSMGQICPGCHQ